MLLVAYTLLLNIPYWGRSLCRRLKKINAQRPAKKAGFFMTPWFARGLHYEIDPEVLRAKKCRLDHTKRMDEILASLIVAGGGILTETCHGCESSLVVAWWGIDRWEMREFPPRMKREKDL